MQLCCEFTTCWLGDPLLYLKMVLRTHFLEPDLDVHLALMKLPFVPDRLVPGAPFPVVTWKSLSGMACGMLLKSSHFPPW